MRDEALANGDAVARDDAQHAGGQNVLRELGEAKERQRRLLGGLKDLAVARGDRRSELPDRHHERVVPRADAPHDPERLAPDHRRVPGDVLARGLSLEVARGARKEAQVVGRERHLVARGHERLAHVARFELRELLGVLIEHVGELVQELGALLRRRIEPGRQRLLRRLDGAVDVVRATGRDVSDRLAGRGVDHLHRLAGRGIGPFAADEALVARGRGAHGRLLYGGDLS